MVNEIGCT